MRIGIFEMILWLTVFATAFVIVVVMMIVCILGRRSEQSFYEKWPPMDDDEFVRRCPPGTDRETALTVRRIVSEQLGVPYERIHPEQSFIDDFEA